MEGTTVAEYFWHFGFSGEGNWSEEAEPDPIVYNQAGEYTVTLTAWGADGNRATVKKVVTVLADNVVPTADFSYSPMMVNVGDEVTFTDKSTDSDGEIVSREWVFPDGSTSTETNPSYTFTQKGMFQVKLTVADDRGGESSATKSINVRDGDVSDFTLLRSTEVASADALCDANVVTVSDLGYVYAVTGDGKLVALDAEGAVAWEYDAAAQDKVNLRKEIAYPSVDADGTVYWVAHAYGDDSAVPTVYAFEGSTGSVLWKNQTAYAAGARIAFSTPSVGPNMVVVGSRGTNGAIRGFEKSSGRNTAQATPANGGGTSGTIVLKNGVVIFTNTGEYGYGIMVPDDQFVWSPVPTADTFAPGKTLSAGRCQPCVGADNCVYLPGKIKEGSGGSWNIACFDCTNLTASSTKTPKWSVAVPDGFVQGGASLSADGGRRSTSWPMRRRLRPSTRSAPRTVPPSGRIRSMRTATAFRRWTTSDRCMSPPRPDTTSCCRPTASRSTTNRSPTCSRVRSRSPSGATPTCWAKTLRRASSRSTRWRCRA